MSLQKDLAELVQAGLLSEDTADQIRAYYKQKRSEAPNRLITIFGILGAILIGLGIILIIAHNWDNLSRGTKTILSFLPLLIGQSLCGYVILKKMDSSVWRESTSAFLFFAVGASISLISQVYNIPGDLSAFLCTWMLLTLPIVYLLRASSVSLFYIIGITAYGMASGWGNPDKESIFYWLLLLLIAPYYYWLYKNKPQSNFMTFHNWLIPLSLIICLGTIADDHEQLLFVAYCSLFGLFYLIGNLDFYSSLNLSRNGFRVLGAIGTIILLLILSYDWFWNDLRTEEFDLQSMTTAPEFILSTIITGLAIYFLYRYLQNASRKYFSPLAVVFLVFIVVFMIGFFSGLSTILVNLIVFAIGVLTIKNGIKEEHFGILNYGLLTIVALIGCRFTDTDLGFLFRGLLFVLVGIGFIATNYWMLKKRNA